MRYTIDVVDEKNIELNTVGADKYNLFNIKTRVKTNDLIEDAKDLLTFILDYQIEYKTKIFPNQTMTYGFWLIKLEEKSGFLEISEFNPESQDFVEGCELTLKIWSEQQYYSQELGIEFEPPTADKLVTCTKEILNNKCKDITGARYTDEDEEHSGWIIYSKESDLEESNEKNLISIRLYEFIKKRFDIIGFVGLPPGARFNIENGVYDAWLDEEI